MFHLFHPALVHFSVAFVVFGGTCEGVGQWLRHERLVRWGSSLLLVGLASLVPAIASGYLAANTLSLPGGTEPLLAAHERTAWFLLGLLLASQFWKAWCGGRIAPPLDRVYALVLLAVVALAGYGAFLGGRMVYAHGIGVL
jgi:uncharacterized membrane protein